MPSGFLFFYRVYEPDETNWKHVREALLFKERTPYIGLLERVFAFPEWDPSNRVWGSYDWWSGCSESFLQPLSFEPDAYPRIQVEISHETYTGHIRQQQELLRGKARSSLFSHHEKTNRLQSRIEDKQWKTERLKF